MSDLTSRLRAIGDRVISVEPHKAVSAVSDYMTDVAILSCEAADEIERLRAELAMAIQRKNALAKTLDARTTAHQDAERRELIALADNDELRAELYRLRKQEPAAWMYQSDNPKHGGKLTDIGVSRHQWRTKEKNGYGMPISEHPLYAEPKPAQVPNGYVLVEIARLDRLLSSMADQQARPDDFWREERDAMLAAAKEDKQ